MDRPIEGVAKLNPDTGDGEFISVSNELNFTYTPPPLECRVEGLLSKRRGTDGLNCPMNGGVEYLDGIATKEDQVPPAAANLVQTCATASSECTTACVPSIPCSTNPETSPNCIGYAQCGILVSLPVATGLAKTCANPLSGECQTICSQAKAHCPIPAASAAIALAGGATAEAAAGSWAVAAAAAKENSPNCGGYGACAIAHAAYAAGMAAMAAAAGATATSECNRWICCTRLCESKYLGLEKDDEKAIQTAVAKNELATAGYLQKQKDALQNQKDARKDKRRTINDKLNRGEYAEWDKASDTERSMFLVLGGQQQSESLWKIFQVNCLDGGDYGAQPSLGFEESLCNKTDPFSSKALPPQWTGAVVAESIPGWLRNELVIDNPDQSREITKTGTRKSTYVSSVQRVSCVSGGGLHNHNLARGGDRCKQMKADTSRGLGFGVWEIVTSLTDAESFVLGTKTSSQSYSVGERFWVVQQDGGLLMTNLDPKDKSYTQDRQTLAEWGGVVSDDQDALLPRVYAAMVARYPGMTMSGRLSAIFADLMGTSKKSGQWKVMEVGHSAEGDSTIELHSRVQGRGVEGERGGTRVQGPNSDWLVFGAVNNDARGETPRFVRLQMLNLIVSLMCILIVIYIGSTLAKAQKTQAVKALAESVEQERRRAVQRKKRGIYLTMASARAGAAQEKGVPTEWGGGGTDTIRSSRAKSIDVRKMKMVNSAMGGLKQLTGKLTGRGKRMREEAANARENSGEGGNSFWAERSETLAIAQAKFREAKKQHSKAEREFQEADLRMEMESMHCHMRAAVFETNRMVTENEAKDRARRKNPMQGKVGKMQSHRAKIRFKTKERAMQHVLDCHSGIAIEKILIYEAVGHSWRTTLWRSTTHGLYPLLMRTAIVVHCLLGFFEAPMPVVTFNNTVLPFWGTFEGKFELILMIQGICIALHAVDALVMIATVGIFNSRVTVMPRKGKVLKLRHLVMRDSLNAHIVAWCVVTSLFIVDWVLQAVFKYTLNKDGWFGSGLAMAGSDVGSRDFLYILLPASAPLRPLLLAIRNAKIRFAGRNFCKTMAKSLHVFAMLILLVVIAALIGVMILSRHYGEATTFNNWVNAWKQIFVFMLTAENYPSLVYPAAKCADYTAENMIGNYYAAGGCENSWYMMYFVFFIIVGMLYISGLTIAVFQDLYSKHAREYMSEEKKKRRAGIIAAFCLLDEDMDGSLTLSEMEGFLNIPMVEFKNFKRKVGEKRQVCV